MSRIMAFDYGTKRVGVAVTDPLGLFAQPLDTVLSHEVFDFVKRYLERNPVSRFVIGRSMNLDSSDNPVQEHIDAFRRGLARLFPAIEQVEVDERLTSKMAKAVIVESLPKEKRKDKALLDRVSAALILQTHLDTILPIG